MLVLLFFCYIACHVAVYAFVARKIKAFQTERVIFLYHFVPACGIVLALCAAWITGTSALIPQAIAVVSLQGIYSLSFLELWSLTQGGYTLTILTDVQRKGGAADFARLSQLCEIGSDKQHNRLRGLQHLRFVSAAGNQYSLTSAGRTVAMFFWSIFRLVNHKVGA